jgi:NADPH:quinone reductase-like Zn-dependent oxidoreductase
VLILDTSSVSLFALQFAKAAGAHVIATSSPEERLEKLERLGADRVINYKAELEWGRRAKALTDGRGVDHVIEVGGPATLAQSIAASRTGGHIALIGVLTGLAAEGSIPALFSNQIRISGISIGSRADQEDMIRGITVNRLKPVVDRCFSLQEVVGAAEYYEAQRHFGKVPRALSHRARAQSACYEARYMDLLLPVNAVVGKQCDRHVSDLHASHFWRTIAVVDRHVERAK